MISKSLGRKEKSALYAMEEQKNGKHTHCENKADRDPSSSSFFREKNVDAKTKIGHGLKKADRKALKMFLFTSCAMFFYTVCKVLSCLLEPEKAKSDLTFPGKSS